MHRIGITNQMDWGVPGRKRVEEKSQLFFCLVHFFCSWYHFQSQFLAITYIDIIGSCAKPCVKN